MKYFTPARYGALQDFSRDATMNAADAVWEEAGNQYAEYYRSIEPQLPPGIRGLQSTYYLHDAVVSSMGRKGSHFAIVLQLDTPPNDLLVFDYELIGEPFLDREALPPQHRSEGPVEWMHDEVELTATDPTTCLHSILFSNGWELRLGFIRSVSRIRRCGSPRGGNSSRLTAN